MRHFLPMNDPLDWSSGTNNHLQLSAMPRGLHPGDYARVVIDNMETPRLIKDYDPLHKLRPALSWTTLINHLQTYADENKWHADGAEKAVEHLLMLGASVAEGFYWENDLKDWPFPGDRCLAAWLVALEKDFHEKPSPKNDDALRHCDGSSSFQAGRWLAQRPHLLADVPEVYNDVALYVESLTKMLPERFAAYCQKYSNNVVFKVNTKDPQRSLRQPLSSQYSRKKLPTTNWSDVRLNAVALGMAWAMSMQVKTNAYERVAITLDRVSLTTPSVLFEYRLNHSAWFDTYASGAIGLAKKPLLDLVKLEYRMPYWDTITPRSLAHRRRLNARLCTILMDSGEPHIALALYKLALASAMQSCFSRTNSYDFSHADRLIALTPLIAQFAPVERDRLFKEFIEILHWAPSSSAPDYVRDDPWGTWFDTLDCSVTRIDDRESEEDENSTFTLCMGWLEKWSHPYKDDLNILTTLGGGTKEVGQWLETQVLSVIIAPLELPSFDHLDLF